MSTQYPGGFISSTPPIPGNNFGVTPAPGVWELNQAGAYKVQGIWPTDGVNPPTYWVLTINPFAAAYTSFGPSSQLLIDSSGNIYMTSTTGPKAGPNAYGASIYSFNKNGTFRWCTFYNSNTGSADTPTFNTMILSSAGDLWANGTNENSSLTLVRFNSSTGAFISGQELIPSSLALGGLSGPDSSGFFYGGGYGTGFKNAWVKFDSSGQINSSSDNGVVDGRANSYIYSVHSDSSGNFYGFGTTFNVGFYQKINSGGNVQVTSSYGGSGNYLGGGIMDSKTAPNFFYAWGYPGDATSTFNLYKVSQSNGTTVSASVRFSGFFAFSGTLEVDTSGNLYLMTVNTAVTQTVLTKFNSSLVIQWQRTIVDSSSTSTSPQELTYTSVDDAIVVALSVVRSGVTQPLVLRLPADGSLTGTYGTVTYASATFTTSSVTGTGWSSTSGSITGRGATTLSDITIDQSEPKTLTSTRVSIP